MLITVDFSIVRGTNFATPIKIHITCLIEHVNMVESEENLLGRYTRINAFLYSTSSPSFSAKSVEKKSCKKIVLVVSALQLRWTTIFNIRFFFLLILFDSTTDFTEKKRPLVVWLLQKATTWNLSLSESNDIGRRKIAQPVKLKKAGPNTELQSTTESNT